MGLTVAKRMQAGCPRNNTVELITLFKRQANFEPIGIRTQVTISCNDNRDLLPCDLDLFSFI